MQRASVYAQHAKELRAKINEAELKVLSLYSILAETEMLEKKAMEIHTEEMKAVLDASSKEGS